MVGWCAGSVLEDRLERMVAQPYPRWSQLAASRTLPWLLPRGKWSVSSKRENKSGWMYSDMSDWGPGPGTEPKN